LTAGSLSRFIFAISLASAAMFSWSYLFLAILLLFGISAALVWGAKMPTLITFARYAVILALFVFILHLFSHPGKLLFKLIRFHATAEGAKVGLYYAFKLLILALTGVLLFSAVDPQELISPLERLAGVAGPLGRPIESFAISLFLALRFLPELTALGHETTLAFETRGITFRGNLIHKARIATLIMAPLFVNGFKRSELAAAALNVKGYATRHSRAVLAPITISFGSVIVTVVSVLVIVAGWRTR
jgi:energy-coupling factor transport system permease protein